MADHGEVFTPRWLVEAMLDLVEGETERVESRFLEPACGSGNFLVPVLQRKLAAVHVRYGRSDFERRHLALLALMSVYGIELLEDNVAECRKNLLDVMALYLNIEPGDQWHAAANAVVHANIVHGDALNMVSRCTARRPIVFAEWTYVGKGTFRRRDFRLDRLMQMSSFGQDGTLFADLGGHDIFTPVKDYRPLSVAEIAGGVSE
jgi:hypothetical protein